MDILEDKNFIELLAITDDIERTKVEAKMLRQAKLDGVEPTFKKLLKQWEKKIKSTKMFVNNGDLPPTKYNVQNFNFGIYKVDINGITDNQNLKFSFIPVIPVERFINEDTYKEKIKIIFYKENKWQEMIVDKSELVVGVKLLRLADYGLDVTSENVKHYVNYFNEIMNINKIETLSSVSHLGWKDDKFIPYDSGAMFDGADDFKSIYKAIDTKGDYNTWKETVDVLRANKVVRLLMATVFASPLLEKLTLQPYLVNAWSSLSGNGKTLSCMVAMSIFGNPDTGALRLSSNNTQNYYITVASFMRNLTCYFDELQIVKKNKHLDMDSLVMDLSGQTEKGRLNKNSQAKEVKTWYCNFLFTNNDKLVKENAGEQVYNRVIDMEIRGKIVEDGTKIASIIKRNYGFAGEIYIKYIQSLKSGVLEDRYNVIYNEILNTTKATDKQAGSLASLLLADELAGECMFDNELSLEIDDIKEYINDKDEIRTCMKAKEFIIGLFNANYKRFDDMGYGEVWGRKDEFNYVINMQVLSRELSKGGYEFDTIKKEWAEMDFLKTNSQGRYYHNTIVRKEKGNYVYLKIDEIVA